MSYINSKDLTDGAACIEVHRYARRFDIGCGDSLWFCARCGENLGYGYAGYDPDGPDAGCRECGHGFPERQGHELTTTNRSLMDNFPQFPPHDPSGAGIASAGEVLAWLGLLALAWSLSFIGIGLWLGSVAPDVGAYLHGVLLGILIGAFLIVAVVTRKPTAEDRA